MAHTVTKPKRTLIGYGHLCYQGWHVNLYQPLVRRSERYGDAQVEAIFYEKARADAFYALVDGQVSAAYDFNQAYRAFRTLHPIETDSHEY